MASMLEGVGQPPSDMWVCILQIRAAIVMQKLFRSFRVRRRGLRYLMTIDVCVPSSILFLVASTANGER